MPVDVVVKEDYENKNIRLDEINSNCTIYDIGKETSVKYKEILSQANTIFINGTMGLYEEEAYRNGTEELYKSLDTTTATIIAGGGDAVASVKKLGYEDAFDFLSTGGGATLEYIATKNISCFDE